MVERPRCPRCGADLPDDLPDGRCPRCSTARDLDPSDAPPTNPASGEVAAPSAGEATDHASPPLTDGPGSPEPGLPRGTTIRYFGDYEIQGELGRGGMGVVYRARQVSLNRPVALKMVKAGLLAGEDELRRFKNEAEAVALLDHPGIVPVYEVGDHDGQHYFSMKLVPGGSLVPLLDRYKNDPRSAATLAAEAADAVAHAHMRGILHRDLKPANLLIDDQGHPHVTDFGLAKRLESDADWTHSGAVLGTPAYMSPEQARGHRGGITTATDVYGLGSVLYALLTGRAPFAGSHPALTLEAVRNAPPDPPSRFNPQVPRDLETICLKCLEKDPKRRYATSQALADDLRAWLDSRPIAARRVGAAERAWLWCRRRPAIAALSAATALAVILGAVTTIIVQSRANKALEIQRKRAEDRESQAIDAVKRFRDAVANNPELQNNPALRDLRKTLLKEPLAFFQSLRERLQAEGGPDSLGRLASAASELGILNSEIGDRVDALNAWEQALEIRKRLAGENPDDDEAQHALAECYSNVGLQLRAVGRHDDGIESHKKSREIHERLVRKDPADTRSVNDLAENHNEIGVMLQELGRIDEALASFQEAEKLLDRFTHDHPENVEAAHELGRSLAQIGLAYADTGRNAEAAAAYERAGPILERLAREHPEKIEHRRDLSAYYNDVGNLHRTLEQLGECIAYYEKARGLQEQLVREQPANIRLLNDLAGSHSNLGAVYSLTGKVPEALDAYEQASAIWDRLATENPSVPDFRRRVATSRNNLGHRYRLAGRWAEAESAFREALEIQRKLAEDYPEMLDYAHDLGATLHNIGLNARDDGRPEEGLASMREGIALQRKAVAASPRNPEYRRFMAIELASLAETERALGNTAEADAALRELDNLRANDPAMEAADARLKALIAGEPAKDNAERLAMAQRAYDLRRYNAAAKLWGEALDSDPKVAEDRQAQHAYNASCSASLAASGQGLDAPGDESARAALRARALNWLKADRAAWSKLIESGPPQLRPAIAQILRHWLEDSDLASVRDPDPLGKLPEAERAAWRELWAGVASAIDAASRPTGESPDGVGAGTTPRGPAS